MSMINVKGNAAFLHPAFTDRSRICNKNVFFVICASRGAVQSAAQGNMASNKMRR